MPENNKSHEQNGLKEEYFKNKETQCQTDQCTGTAEWNIKNFGQFCNKCKIEILQEEEYVFEEQCTKIKRGVTDDRK